MNRETQDIIHVKIKYGTFLILKKRFHASKNETAVHYFERLAEYLKGNNYD